ncbi:MAG: BBP7 family outer membrane beta-barrel protein [Gemmataceae bacterium]
MYWLTGNYLIGWIPKMSLPTPLVTTGLITDTVPGALRQPGTQILYGTKIPFDAFQGFKVDAGLFCSEDRTWSIDGSGFVLLNQTTNQSYASDDLGNPILTRPVYNVVAEVEGAVVDSLPGLARGGINITADSQMWGFETNTRCHVGSGPLRGDLLMGFRFMRLEENLTIQDRLAPLRDNTLTFLGQFVNGPNSLMDMDHFGTQNEFYGGQVGGTIIYEDSWYFLRIMGKVGFGAIKQTANIEGSSTLVTPTGNTNAVGGILALSSNIGNHSRTVFGILPEWGVSGGFYVTQNIRISAGYSLLMWSRAVRPGDLIDRGVNPGLIPTSASYGLINGPDRPALRWNDSTFWMQSATAGLEFTF